jgi:glutamate formiminotransferase/formiminotetrahydrofolate cyclodeaminase
MEKIIECIPNFSEGRDEEKINQIISEIESAGVELLDREMDPSHNRAVITFVGEPEAVLEAAFLGAKKAAELIDLTKHKGEHPRMGATDVIPFVPISNATTRECVELARRLGKRIAEELKIPIYLYEAAATRPDRQNLANIRRGEFEGIRDEIETNPDRKPDFGAAKIHPTAGATVVGARFPLIAFNLNLNTSDVETAQKIAKAIRFMSGGFRYCKALGFELKDEGVAQVSINMTEYTKTPLYRVFETAKREAERYGVSIKESEIVGLVPEQALIDTARYYLQLDRFNEDQILEYRLRGKAGKQSILEFLNELAMSKPTPGGGSVAALEAALGTGLLAMVTGITCRKTKDAELKEFHGHLKLEMYEFYKYIEKDKLAFDKVMEAFKLSDESEAEKKKKEGLVQSATKYAAQVPLEVCKKVLLVYPYAKTLAQKGLKSAISDVGVALHALHSGFIGARLNVLINLKSINDEEFNSSMNTTIDSLTGQEEKMFKEIEKIFLTTF